MHLPIQLPEFWIKPRSFFVYSNGAEKPGENLQIFETDAEVEPTVEAALEFLKNVPEEFRASVNYVHIERAQPIQKVRYGQGELADDGRVYVGSMEFSVEYTMIVFRETCSGPWMKKPKVKRGTRRMGSDPDSRLYVLVERRNLWCIHEKSTDTWCCSSKHGNFGSFDEAVLFVSEENAKAAMKNMDRSLEDFNRLQINGKYCIFDDKLIISERELEACGVGIVRATPIFEIVECTLST